MSDLLSSLSRLEPWQIALAASWLLLQACLIPSLPEEVVIATLGVLWGQGLIGFPMALAAVLAGLLPANAAAVLVGGRVARGLRCPGPLGRAAGSAPVQEILGAVRRHGRLVVLATRFTPLVRGPVYLACGLSGMGVSRFVPVDALAALVQVPLLLWAGAHLGAGAGSLAAAWQRVGALAAGVLGLGVVVVLLRRARRRATPERSPSPGGARVDAISP